MTLRGWALAAIAAVLPLGQGTPVRPAARADAAISGVVLDEATGQPLADAFVQLGSITLRGTSDVQQTQLTDGRGRFVFTNLPAGADYSITTQKPGYFDGAFGRVSCSTSGPARLAVADGQWMDDANVRMCRPGSVSGTVFDERNRPVVGVYVRVILPIRVAGHETYALGPLTLTDDRGMFRIGNLRSGSYIVMVPSVAASAPADASTATLQGLSPAALAQYRSTGRQLPAGDPMVDIADDVHVRVSGYPIPPPAADGRVFTYPATFSGGTSLSRASVVTIASGENRMSADIHITPVPAVRIAGVVEGPAGPVGSLPFRLLPEGGEELGPGTEAGTALTRPDGTFVFASVPAGRYVIDVSTANTQYTIGQSSLDFFYGVRSVRMPGATGSSMVADYSLPGAPDGVGYTTSSSGSAQRLWGRVSVDASSGDVRDVRVALKPSVSISGRVVIENDPRFPALPQMPRYLSLETATGSASEGIPGAFGPQSEPGTFRVDNVAPGRYLLRPIAGAIKSVLLDGRERADLPIDTTAQQDIGDIVVTITNAAPSLAGTVRDATGAIAARAAAIVFPAEPERWVDYGLFPRRIASVHASNTGMFRVSALPAGDYLVIAVPETQGSAWQQPGFFARAAARATRVSLGWGEAKTADVRVVEAP